VLAPDGTPAPGSIAELATVRLGGTDQAVMIRAEDPEKPVLLYLSGGPGQSDVALSRVLAEGWTHDFVFVDWDQRGNGKSYAAIDPLSTFTLDQAVSDTLELTDYLRARFGERKIYLMGESWGTILGVLAVQRQPDLYHAWIGSGQAVDAVETDRHLPRADGPRAAQRRRRLAAKLQEIGALPYRDIPWRTRTCWPGTSTCTAITPSAIRKARRRADAFGSWARVQPVEKAKRAARPDRHLRPAVPAAVRFDLPRRDFGGARLHPRRHSRAAWTARRDARVVRGLGAPIKERVTFADAPTRSRSSRRRGPAAAGRHDRPGDIRAIARSSPRRGRGPRVVTRGICRCPTWSTDSPDCRRRRRADQMGPPGPRRATGEPDLLRRGMGMTHVKMTAHFDAPIERVFELGSDFKRYPEWNVTFPEVLEVTGPGDKLGTRFHSIGLVLGRRLDGWGEIIEVDKPRLLKISGTTVGGGKSVITYRSTPAGVGTDVEIEAEYELPASIIGKVADRLFVEKSVARDLRHSIENFKALVEAPIPVLA
jgi:pimeloyl-ACP methyl ester carboxylesterase/uncharacterized membrane protein